MPRPRKLRCICRMPQHTRFGSLDHPCEPTDSVCMTLDEYEAIRLIDLEELSQEECALQMNVARTTVQMIYTSARRKLALCLTSGQQLLIGGGEYRLCEGGSSCCHCARCWKHGDE